MENTEEKLSAEQPLVCVDYDVKNEEENRAFLCFQKKFVYPHNIKITVAFGIVAAVFIASIIA